MVNRLLNSAKRIQEMLTSANIASAIIGGIAVSVWGEPRLTICTAEDLIIYKMISTRGRDRDDVVGIIRRQGNALDDAYVLDWLRQFEQALDDSTLVATYQRLRGKAPRSRSAE